MADSEILDAIKSLQTKLDSQTVAVHHTLQQYMLTVDSRLEDLRSQIKGLPSGPTTGPSNPPPFSQISDGSSGTHDSNPLLRTMKLEVPKFDGTDPNGWAFRINEYFDFHGTSEDLRLCIVSFHLEGRASAWYQWMKANDLLTSWKDFLQNLKFRFGASLYEDHQGNLSKLTQKSSVAEFQTEFEDLMNKVTGISEPLLISFFITGLRVDIRRELLLSRPSSLMEAFALARMFEARGDESKVTSRPWSKWTPKTTTSSFHPTPTNHSPASAPAITPPQPAPSTLPPLLPTPSLPIKRLSPQELREKKEKGLCYNCDQKWSNSHRCRSKFLLLLGTEDVDEAMGPPINSEISDVVEETIIAGDISSLNALAGQNTPRSLRLLGEINQQPVQVLIDSGSTHNFIKPAVAEVLGLAVQDTTTFRVYIGNGDSLVCRYVCSQVALSMQGHVFYIDLYVLPIEGPDIVLGIQWLQLLGKVSHDYAALSMEFFYNGSPVFLRGDLSLSPRPISFHQLEALMSHDQIHGLFEFFQFHTTTDAQDTLSVPTTAAKFDFPPDLPSPDASQVHSLPSESYNNQPMSVPIAICAQRQVLVHGIPQTQILVQWQDCAPENATWEALSEFTKQYPNFHLEDKVIPQGVEGDTTPILQLDKPNSASSINSEEKAQANSSEAIQNRPQDNIKPISSSSLNFPLYSLLPFTRFFKILGACTCLKSVETLLFGVFTNGITQAKMQNG
ncbi:hypothetical protein KPL71_007489 [Citrus sinensis]|uniref:Uncharacterized protein n=1 Tax=Citrus sinensis TaxID=2711 RepID=A0ACB8LZ35_CITSI|nr:hypothetical protein KPL71_007489 [Citrus sinensis]